MDIKQLRYFARIAELGSFSKAAADLRVAQSALSYQIRKLETELQVSLLARHARGVVLTQAGTVVMERVQNIGHELDQIRATVSIEQAATGHISFAVPPSVTPVLAPQVVERFSQLYPQVRLMVREAKMAFIYDLLFQHEIDFAIFNDPGNNPDLVATPLIADALHLIGARGAVRPPGKCCSITDLHDLPILLPSKTYVWRRRLENAFHDRGAVLKLKAEVDSLVLIKELVTRGFGYTVLPRSVVYNELARAEFWAMPIHDIASTDMLALVRLKHRKLSLAGLELQRLLLEEAAKLASAGWGIGAP